METAVQFSCITAEKNGIFFGTWSSVFPRYKAPQLFAWLYAAYGFTIQSEAMLMIYAKMQHLA